MAKTTIGVNVRITEVNRYDFNVEVDENATKEQQDAEAKAKVKKFLEGNIPSPNVGTPYIDGVKCVDVEYGVGTVNGVPDVIEVNEG
jgi:hypothetical protein